MNIIAKQFMVLTASFMIGTPCLAMALPDQPEPETPVVAKPTAREKAREEAQTATTTTAVVSQDPFDLESLPHELIHSILMATAEGDIEDFKRMILVSPDWFHILTGTGENNDRSSLYPKKYLFVIDNEKGFENYNSVHRFHSLPQIRVQHCAGRSKVVVLHREIRQGLIKMPDPIICHFPSPEALTSLDLTLLYPRGVELESIAKLTNLEKLSLPPCKLERNSLFPLGTFTKLKELNLGGNILSSANLDDLRALTNLQKLNLSNCTLTDHDSLFPLTTFTQLKGLNLNYTNLTEVNLSHLSVLTNLETLNLLRCGIQEAYDLVTLLELPNLKEFNFHENPILNDLSRVAKYIDSRSPELVKTSLDARLRLISGLKNLTSLEAEDDFSIEFLPFLPKGLLKIVASSLDIRGHCNLLPRSLTDLEVYQSFALLDNDMKELVKLIDLQVLGMNAPNLTDEGLLHLSKLTNLEDLVLPPQASDDIISRLKKHLEFTDIDRYED